MIRFEGDRWWLYTAVDPATNELLHAKFEPVRNDGLSTRFFRELREKHNVDDATFLVDDNDSLQNACQFHRLDFRYEPEGNRNAVERISRNIKQRTIVFSNSFSHAHATTVDEWFQAFAFAWYQLTRTLLRRPIQFRQTIYN